MSVLDDIHAQVRQVAEERRLTEDRAFGYWFLEELEDLSQEEAENTIVDGPWDGGRDAVYFNEEDKELRIFQFKYSEDKNYVLQAFADLQNAVVNEQANLRRSEQVTLHVVTILAADQEVRDAQRSALRRIRTWLTRNSMNVQAEIELFDLKKFAQLFEKLYGVDLDVEFKNEPLRINGALLGLLNAANLGKYVDREELLAFNIRKFLGQRKGSVSWDMRETLEDEEKRVHFWAMNNGIVCLCTQFEPRSNGAWHFANFTIVNGAQTINTISKFLERNPIFQDPIWVVAKVIRVNETDIEYATTLTKSSNTQTPTNNKDLRAVDALHKRLEQWLNEYFDLKYIYKRGSRTPRGSWAVTMKDMAQAYVAYWKEEPHVSFGYVARIFGNSDYYGLVFPAAEIGELRERGDQEAIRRFLLDRLVPLGLLRNVRLCIEAGVEQHEQDKKWKSLAYFVLWVYRELFEALPLELSMRVFDQAKAIVEASIDPIFDGLQDFCTNTDKDIPKDLKVAKFKEDLQGRNFLETNWARKARAAIEASAVGA